MTSCATGIVAPPRRRYAAAIDAESFGGHLHASRIMDGRNGEPAPADIDPLAK